MKIRSAAPCKSSAYNTRSRTGFGAVAEEIIAAARQANAHLIVVDGFSGVRGVDRDPQEARQFLYRLAGTLGALGMTTLVTNEANPRDPANFPEATTADVIIGLSYTLGNGRHRRGIEVIKMRGAAQLPGLHSLTLSASGMIVYPRLESRVTRDANNGTAPSPQRRGVRGITSAPRRRCTAPSCRLRSVGI